MFCFFFRSSYYLVFISWQPRKTTKQYIKTIILRFSYLPNKIKIRQVKCGNVLGRKRHAITMKVALRKSMLNSISQYLPSKDMEIQMSYQFLLHLFHHASFAVTFFFLLCRFAHSWLCNLRVVFTSTHT